MVNPSKAKGTAAESAVVNYLREWWPHAERRALAGSADKGDVTGIPSVVIEIKNAAKLAFGPWLKEAEVERINAKASLGVVWAKRRGKTDPADWFVVMDGRTFTRLLREAGW